MEPRNKRIIKLQNESRIRILQASERLIMSNRKINPDNLGEMFHTPVDVTNNLLEALTADGIGIKRDSLVLDPCAGHGNIIRALRWNNIVDTFAIESDPRAIDQLTTVNGKALTFNTSFFVNELSDDFPSMDYIIINPPYTLIEQFIERSFMFLKYDGHICVLLRLGHLAGVKRGRFLRKYQPKYVYILCQRPSFSGTAADIGGYAWVVWDSYIDPQRDTIVRWIRPGTNGVMNHDDEHTGNGQHVGNEMGREQSTDLTATTEESETSK